MVDLTSFFDADKTLKACDEALVAAQFDEKPRPYLGASSIGEACSRKLWYRFRWCKEVFDAATLKRFRDGHITENTVIEQLRLNKSLKLTTNDIQEVEHGIFLTTVGGQIKITDVDGHFAGHLDGEIEGLIEAPKTIHVFEAKAVGEKKFNEIKKYKLELGEKLALRKYSPVYYAQIVLYMFKRKRDRAFHVFATPGARDWVSIRTESDTPFAKSLIEKARRIVYANDAPEGVSRDPAFFDCRYCGMFKVCHERKLPERNCRTCLHSSPTTEGKWTCTLYKKEINYEEQLVGCPSHAYIPSFVNGEIKGVNGTQITYIMKDGSVWVDGK